MIIFRIVSTRTVMRRILSRQAFEPTAAMRPQPLGDLLPGRALAIGFDAEIVVVSLSDRAHQAQQPATIVIGHPRFDV